MIFPDEKSVYHLDRWYPNQAHTHSGFHLEGASYGSCLEAGTWCRESILKLGLGVSQWDLWFGDPAPCSPEGEGAVKYLILGSHFTASRVLIFCGSCIIWKKWE